MAGRLRGVVEDMKRLVGWIPRSTASLGRAGSPCRSSVNGRNAVDRSYPAYNQPSWKPGPAEPLDDVRRSLRHRPQELRSIVFDHQDQRTLINPEIMRRNPADVPSLDLEGRVEAGLETVGVGHPEVEDVEILDRRQDDLGRERQGTPRPPRGRWSRRPARTAPLERCSRRTCARAYLRIVRSTQPGPSQAVNPQQVSPYMANWLGLA